MSTEPYIGEIKLLGFNFAPRGYAFCAGQLLSIAEYTALFALIGTTYGGDGQVTFALPDLRGRLPIGQGQGPGLTNYQIGQVGGVENVTLLASNMPMHTHPAVATATNTIKVSNTAANVGTPITGSALAAAKDVNGDNVNLYTNAAPNTVLAAGTLGVNVNVTLANSGGNQPFTILQPTLAINYSIALEGIFPSRN